MNLQGQIAKQLRDVYFGGNWTSSNFKEALTGINWQQAIQQVHSFNTIASLVYHTTYYVRVVLKVLQGEPLTAKDKYSFNLPPIRSQEDWEVLVEKTWTDVETFAALIEQLPEPKLWETFIDGKYGNFYRNFHGIIEHSHYHLGQIVLIKKIILQTQKTA